MNDPDLLQRAIRLSAEGQTDPGRKRTENQDNFLIADLSRAALAGGYLVASDGSERHNAGDGGFVLGEKGALIVVADGMGGAAGGRTASRLAIQWIYREMTAQWGTERNESPARFACLLRESVEAANARIHERAQQGAEYQGMGTTATAVGVLDGGLYLAQVGDSRAYLVRGGIIHQLTRDQSLVQNMIDAGTLSREEAEHSKFASVILQALGVEPEVHVDLTYQQLRRGDLLLLCSDGLSRVVPDQQIAQVMHSSLDLDRVCAELIALANAQGGPDNITVVAVRFDGSGLQHPQQDSQIGYQPLVLTDLG